MVKRREQHVSADRGAPGARGDNGERRHHRGEVAVIHEVMLREPNRIEPGPIRVLGLLQHRGVKLGRADSGTGRITKIQHVSEFHRALARQAR